MKRVMASNASRQQSSTTECTGKNRSSSCYDRKSTPNYYFTSIKALCRPGRWSGIMGTLGDRLFSVNPRLPHVPDATSKIFSTWFLTPERHLVEFFCFSLWFFYFLAHQPSFVGWNSTINPSSSSEKTEQRFPKAANEADYVFFSICAFTALGILYFKVTRRRHFYLLQPCNTWIFILTYLTVARTQTATRLFNFYLHTMWGSWIGMLVCDLRDYHSRVEIGFFFCNHIVLVTMPIVYLARQTFPLYAPDAYSCYVVFAIQHWWIFLPVSIISGWHIQMMTHPPRQLSFAGSNYRIVMMVVSYVITALVRSWVGRNEQYLAEVHASVVESLY
eukprot:m.207898 g.207898  ORF g.207898 m.207898 type:complete len:332 (+) comp18948_c0_seq3:145-1140(+)